MMFAASIIVATLAVSVPAQGDNLAFTAPYRLQAWHCWEAGATGSFFWAFGDNSGSSSWNEYFVRAGPYTPLFLDSKGVTAAKQMEAIREGVQDYEYFVMLQAAVDRALAAGKSGGAVDIAPGNCCRTPPPRSWVPAAR